MHHGWRWVTSEARACARCAMLPMAPASGLPLQDSRTTRFSTWKYTQGSLAITRAYMRVQRSGRYRVRAVASGIDAGAWQLRVGERTLDMSNRTADLLFPNRGRSGGLAVVDMTHAWPQLISHHSSTHQSSSWPVRPHRHLGGNRAAPRSRWLGRRRRVGHGRRAGARCRSQQPPRRPPPDGNNTQRPTAPALTKRAK